MSRGEGSCSMMLSIAYALYRKLSSALPDDELTALAAGQRLGEQADSANDGERKDAQENPYARFEQGLAARAF